MINGMILMCKRFHLGHDYRVADGRRSIVLVVFIGGVTFAEISALRYLASKVYIKLQKFTIKKTLFLSAESSILASA